MSAEETRQNGTNSGSSNSNNYQQVLNLDGILSTQPELGPSIPDGGYGWIVFLGTLFFQSLIPSLVVSFGIFLAFSKLENGTLHISPSRLWDDKLLYAPLLFCISKGVFDSPIRRLVMHNTSPRLMVTGGTCLTCAGLLILWMGMTSAYGHWLFIAAGILTGLGACLQMAQCEILLVQYFRMKLPVLRHLSQAVNTLGFIAAPIVLGHNMLHTSLSHVLLWYQAIILQGLIISITFKRPAYLKTKQSRPYQFVANNLDDEEDIFSKNTRELQIKRQTSSGSHVSKIEIHPEPGTSAADETPKEWEKFEDEEQNRDWEKFEDGEPSSPGHHWEKFEDDEPSSPQINNLSFAEERKITNPSPLFADIPVNNNSTYAYDDEVVERHNGNVFVPTTNQRQPILKGQLDWLKEPSFYKRLLLITTNRFSIFVFYVLFPSYLYLDVESIKIRHMTFLMGVLSVVRLFVLGVGVWIPIDKRWRPFIIWPFSWLASIGCFVISNSKNEFVLVAGAVLILAGITALHRAAKPLLGLNIKGEMGLEYGLLSGISGLLLSVFFFMNITFRTCLNLMAILYFFSGALWFTNIIYKGIR